MKEIVIENGNTLAFVGDAVYSLLVRKELVKKGIHKPNILQQRSVKFVSASGQAKVLRILLELQYFSDIELEIIYRGRNAKSESIAKNADVIEYRMATGLEALFGYLYLYEHHDRIQTIFEKIKEII